MPNDPVTLFETAAWRTKGDRAALSLTLETLFDRYTSEGRYLPGGGLSSNWSQITGSDLNPPSAGC